MEHTGFSLHNLSFAFGKDDQPFFNSLSLTLQAGQIHFLHGRNGSGKSTLFRVIDGTIHSLEKISGSYALNGIAYPIVHNNVAQEYKIHVKHVVQQIQSMLVEQMTVAQNIMFTSFSRYPLFKKIDLQNNIDPFLQTAGIEQGQPVYTLSGGQKQLLALVMCTHNAGQVLLLDEPTAALDDTNTKMLMHNIQTLAKEKNLIIIIICHDQEIVDTYRTGRLITITKESEKLARTVRVE
jgi:ABC-type multidrug transport system ATPase subunit